MVDPLDAGRAVHLHGHDVDPPGGIGAADTLQVGLRRPDDAPLFSSIDRFLGAHHSAAAARAHLDEDQLTAVFRHQVDLAPRTAVVPTPNTQPSPLYPGLGEPLAGQSGGAPLLVHRASARTGEYD